ncbi:MAG TPA: IS1595 family transposase [Gaiellaceae bacterium]|jgi:transposase-like protein|nr:IS1595 family transposase [Gaiellaceae bacterium]
MGTNLTETHPRVTIADWRDVVAVADPRLREDHCRSYLEHLRWPGGLICPRCGSDRVTRVPTRNQIDCRECRYRFSVTSGTRLHDSAVPLWKWLVAVSLLIDSEDGFPAHRLATRINVSYKTAWSLGHRIRDALGNGETDGANVAAVSGSYHLVSEKYAGAYRAEHAWRARNRANPDAFADVLRALLHAAA